ncbi:WD repeat-containing protein 74-like [Littorina saxatilis]|uniref:WD repeat-containing protein 74 n=1 Tax=Littorina saxatilis TaxID=31220 RepID=A0AAN9GJZ3_9CAEN
MAATCAYNVFVGAETGLLKGLQTAERSWQNLNSVADTNRSREITCLCWGEDDKAELCAGLRDNCVLTFDASGTSAKESGPFFGASGHMKCVAKFEERFLSGFSEGMVALWSGDGDEEDAVKIQTGDNLWAMAQCASERSLIATGGKENPLKLWDLNKPDTPVFVSKNVKNDWLNLRVPVWVSRIQFLSDNRRVVTGTGHNQVRVYDPKSSQRRPVIDFNFLTYPVTGLSVCPLRDDQVIVGNTYGDMGLLDLRKQRTVQLYKGFAGGITDIQCHSTAPVVVSCGIDRYVRVHDIESKALLDKFYLKSRLNCLLLSDEWPLKEEEQNSKTKRNFKSQSVKEAKDDSGVENDQGADDVIWDSLETVETKTVTKTAQKRKAVEKHAERNIAKQPKQHKKTKNQKKSG